MSDVAARTPVLLFRSTSRNFPLDLQPELEKAGHPMHAVESLEDFIASPLRARPFLAVIEVGHLADLDRALIAFEWTEQMQPLAPARYLLLLSSKNISLGDKALRFSAAEAVALPQPARNILFKLELQSRLLASQSATEKKKQPRGFSARLEESTSRRRILVARGQDEKAGHWRMGESSPQGQIRWRWIRNPDRETPGEKEDFHWIAETQQAPLYDKKLDAWVIEGDAPNLLCFRGEAQVFSAVAPAGSAEKSSPNEAAAPPTRKQANREPGSEEAGSSTTDAHPGPAPPAENVPNASGSTVQDPAPEGAGFHVRLGTEEPAPKPNAPLKQSGTSPSPESGSSQPRQSLAKLKEPLNDRSAKRAGGASGEEKAEQAPATGTIDDSGQALSQARRGGASDNPEAAARVATVREGTDTAEKPARSAAEPRALPTAKGAATHGQGDPDDFSRSAPFSPHAPESSAPAERTPGSGEALRGGPAAVPFHTIPSRAEAAMPGINDRRIAGEATQAPEGTHTSGTGAAAPAGSSESKSGTPPAPDPGSSAVQPAGRRSGHTPAPEPAAATPSQSQSSMPSTSLPGGAFDSQLPPLEQGRAATLPTKETEIRARPAPEPLAPEERGTTVHGGPALLEPETRIDSKAPSMAAAGHRAKAPGAAAAIEGEHGHTATEPTTGASPGGERSFLRDRLYLLMTLAELADRESSWHPVGKYRIYLSAGHRYYGLPHPADVLPLWIYEGELAPEYIDDRKAWKFYDRLPIAVYSLDTMPQEVLEYVCRMAGREPPKAGERTETAVAGPGATGANTGAQVAGENPDHYQPEDAKKKRGLFGRVAEIVKKIIK